MLNVGGCKVLVDLETTCTCPPRGRVGGVVRVGVGGLTRRHIDYTPPRYIVSGN